MSNSLQYGVRTSYSFRYGYRKYKIRFLNLEKQLLLLELWGRLEWSISSGIPELIINKSTKPVLKQIFRLCTSLKLPRKYHFKRFLILIKKYSVDPVFELLKDESLAVSNKDEGVSNDTYAIYYLLDTIPRSEWSNHTFSSLLIEMKRRRLEQKKKSMIDRLTIMLPHVKSEDAKRIYDSIDELIGEMDNIDQEINRTHATVKNKEAEVKLGRYRRSEADQKYREKLLASKDLLADFNFAGAKKISTGGFQNA